MISKRTLLTIAEIIDAYRVIPRLLLISVGYLVWDVVSWFMTIPNPTTQQAALVTTVVGIIPAVIGLYQSSGRKWRNRNGNSN